MYKTLWLIKEGTNEAWLTWYHFGKAPKFPTWYMEENKNYEIEMVWHCKLIPCPKVFFRCLTHFYKVK